MSITLTEMITRTRQRAEMENGTFVTNDEITHFLNDEIADIHAKMVNIDDGALFGTPSPTLTKIGDNTYQLPSDFMRLVDVNVFTNARWVPAQDAGPQEHYQLISDTYTGDYDVRYKLHLNLTQGRYELWVYPDKDVDKIGVVYIQEAPTLSLGTDTLNWPSNWHVGAVVGAAVKCLVKEESDPSSLMIERDSAVARILKDVRSQKVAEIKTIRDTGRSRSNRRFRLPRLY